MANYILMHLGEEIFNCRDKIKVLVVNFINYRFQLKKVNRNLFYYIATLIRKRKIGITINKF